MLDQPSSKVITDRCEDAQKANKPAHCALSNLITTVEVTLEEQRLNGAVFGLKSKESCIDWETNDSMPLQPERPCDIQCIRINIVRVSEQRIWHATSGCVGSNLPCPTMIEPT